MQARMATKNLWNIDKSRLCGTQELEIPQLPVILIITSCVASISSTELQMWGAHGRVNTGDTRKVQLATERNQRDAYGTTVFPFFSVLSTIQYRQWLLLRSEQKCYDCTILGSSKPSLSTINLGLHRNGEWTLGSEIYSHWFPGWWMPGWWVMAS